MALNPHYVEKKVIKNSKFFNNKSIFGSKKKKKKTKMLSKKYSKYEND